MSEPDQLPATISTAAFHFRLKANQPSFGYWSHSNRVSERVSESKLWRISIKRRNMALNSGPGVRFSSSQFRMWSFRASFRLPSMANSSPMKNSGMPGTKNDSAEMKRDFFLDQ